jgi:hypothetical protein
MCTVCNNSDSWGRLAHPTSSFTAPSNDRRRLHGCMDNVHSSLDSDEPTPRRLFAFYLLTPVYYHLVNMERTMEGVIRPGDRGV